MNSSFVFPRLISASRHRSRCPTRDSPCCNHLLCHMSVYSGPIRHHSSATSLNRYPTSNTPLLLFSSPYSRQQPSRSCHGSAAIFLRVAENNRLLHAVGNPAQRMSRLSHRSLCLLIFDGPQLTRTLICPISTSNTSLPARSCAFSTSSSTSTNRLFVAGS